ncbi:hypothetical protein ACC702_39450, partial [Rhizobium ruizarguesonis]
MLIRPSDKNDQGAIWRIIGPTIRAGETYALDCDLSEFDSLAYWMGPVTTRSTKMPGVTTCSG